MAVWCKDAAVAMPGMCPTAQSPPVEGVLSRLQDKYWALDNMCSLIPWWCGMECLRGASMAVQFPPLGQSQVGIAHEIVMVPTGPLWAGVAVLEDFFLESLPPSEK
eukprot:6369525-Amphidinium_carterae.1